MKYWLYGINLLSDVNVIGQLGTDTSDSLTVSRSSVICIAHVTRHGIRYIKTQCSYLIHKLKDFVHTLLRGVLVLWEINSITLQNTSGLLQDRAQQLEQTNKE